MKYQCRLRVILAELNIKHGEFAKRIGVDRSTFSAIINNKSLPSFETLFAIVEELQKINPNIRLGDIWAKK
jgi:putative transcriptional regulator